MIHAKLAESSKKQGSEASKGGEELAKDNLAINQKLKWG